MKWKIIINSISFLLVFLVEVLINNTLCAQERLTDRMFSRLVIENYNRKNRSEPYACKAYYYDIYKIEGDLAAYTDAKGVMISFGHDYRIALNSLVFIPENMRKSKRSAEWKKFIDISDKNRQAEHREFERSTDIEPSTVILLNAFRRVETNGPLNHHNFRSFSWDVDVLSDTTNEIKFTRRRSRSDSFEGSIFFNKVTNVIDSIHLTSTVWYSRLHNGPVDGWLRVYYQQDSNGKTIPSQIHGGFVKQDVILKTGLVLLNYDCIEQLFDKQKTSDLITYSQFPMVKYNADEWKDFTQILNGIKGMDTRKFPEINTLSAEFKHHHGKPYRDVIHSGLSAVSRFSELYVRINAILENGLLGN